MIFGGALPWEEIVGLTTAAATTLTTALVMRLRSARRGKQPESEPCPTEKTATRRPNEQEASVPALPIVHYEEDDERGHETCGERSSTLTTIPVLYDQVAAIDEPTQAPHFTLASAVRTDTGRCRARNEDSFTFCGDLNLFVVADGMGGHRGGDVASDLAVRVIEGAFKGDRFDGHTSADLPPRASKVARAIQMANRSIRHLARARHELSDMGTTVVAALFSPEKRRLYVGHVGDSRCYRLRDGCLEQMTNDHTLGSLGVSGPTAAQLVRSVGSSRRVLPDILIAEPKIGDVYLLCSDGLPKMVADDTIRRILDGAPNEDVAAHHLVRLANEHGGVDNVTAIVVRVLPTPSMMRSSLRPPPPVLS